MFRLLFKLPRVVQDQREKFESEDLFKKHVREGEVRYTLHRDRPVHERQAKFQAGCRDGHTEIVNSMITSSKEFGIDLNTRNEDGHTGLMFACIDGHIEVVSLIVENRKKYRINIQQKDNSGLTALDMVNNKIRGMVNGSITFKPSLQKLRDILEEAYAADNHAQPSSKRLKLQ